MALRHRWKGELALAPCGAGCTFGSDISWQFNHQNSFEFVVRVDQLAMDMATNGRAYPRLYAEEMWEPCTSAMWIATWYCSAQAVEDRLTEFGADVGQCDKDGRIPLYAAARQGKSDVVRMLVEKHGEYANQASCGLPSRTATATPSVCSRPSAPT